MSTAQSLLYSALIDIFLGNKRGIDDVASFQFLPHLVVLSVGGPPSSEFSGVSFVDVFYSNLFFYGKWLLALCPTLRFFIRDSNWQWQSFDRPSANQKCDRLLNRHTSTDSRVDDYN